MIVWSKRCSVCNDKKILMFAGNCAKTLFALLESLLKQTEILEIIARANKLSKIYKVKEYLITLNKYVCVCICLY